MLTATTRTLAWLCSLSLLTACNGSSNSTTDVNPPQPGPQAVADAAWTDNGSTVSIDVLANDLGQGSALTLSEFTPPEHGEVRIENARIIYEPDAGSFGLDSFTYTIRNTRGQTASARVDIENRIALTLSGAVRAVREEPLSVQARIGAGASTAAVAASPAYSLEVSGIEVDTPVWIEAIGGERGEHYLRQRFVSLLPSLRALLAQASCAEGECTLALESEPRLQLGVLPTAEVGVLAGLVGLERLNEPGLREQLLGYVVAETMLFNAVLIDRAANDGPMDPQISFTVEDTFALVLTPHELAPVVRPQGSPGSGSINNQENLEFLRRRILSDAGWLDTPDRAARRLQSQQLGWLTAAGLGRHFSAWEWSAGHLRSQADAEFQFDVPSAMPQIERRAIDVPVDAQQIDRSLQFSARHVEDRLVREVRCYPSSVPCQRLDVRRMQLTGLLGDYGVLTPFRIDPDSGFESPVPSSVVTLTRALPFPADEIPGRSHVQLTFDSPLDGRFNWNAGHLVTEPGGRFSFWTTDVGNAMEVPRSGFWTLSADRTELLLDEDLGHQYRVLRVADGAGRTLVQVRAGSAGAPHAVHAGGWLSIPGSTTAEFPAAPFRCVPAADGLDPTLAPGAQDPGGLRWLVQADGYAVRTLIEGVDAPAPLPDDRFSWTIENGSLVLQTVDAEPVQQHRFTPVGTLDGAMLVRHSLSVTEPRTGVRIEPIEQQFDPVLLFDCASATD